MALQCCDFYVQFELKKKKKKQIHEEGSPVFSLNVKNTLRLLRSARRQLIASTALWRWWNAAASPRPAAPHWLACFQGGGGGGGWGVVDASKQSRAFWPEHTEAHTRVNKPNNAASHPAPPRTPARERRCRCIMAGWSGSPLLLLLLLFFFFFFYLLFLVAGPTCSL